MQLGKPALAAKRLVRGITTSERACFHQLCSKRMMVPGQYQPNCCQDLQPHFVQLSIVTLGTSYDRIIDSFYRTLRRYQRLLSAAFKLPSYSHTTAYRGCLGSPRCSTETWGSGVALITMTSAWASLEGFRLPRWHCKYLASTFQHALPLHLSLARQPDIF